MKDEISRSSNLRRIMMMFFRHHKVLISLMKIIVFIRFIIVFSTSKVDIL